jgi:hypothetical protein
MHSVPKSKMAATSCTIVLNCVIGIGYPEGGWCDIIIQKTCTFTYKYGRVGGLCGSQTPTPAVFEDFYAWNCDKGGESVNTGDVQFHNFILVNNRLAGYEQKKSLEGEFYTENGPLFKNGFIVGRSPALSSNQQGCTNAGKLPSKESPIIAANIGKDKVFHMIHKSSIIWATCTSYTSKAKVLILKDSPMVCLVAFAHPV